MTLKARTDMAAELLEDVKEELGAERGIIVTRYREGELELCRVDVTNGKGAELLGKAVGSYITVTLPETAHFDRSACIHSLAGLLKCLIGTHSGCVLIACAGNPNITPDALGPLAAEGIIVTRHLKDAEGELFSRLTPTALCRTNVLGTSGIESAEQIKSFAGLVSASAVIVIDALAGRELSGLCRSIQICDTGIAPGSGVGNDRKRIDRELIGVPVISIGVPTVADAYSEGDTRLFVTARDIDLRVRVLADVISAAVNIALQPALTLEEIDLLKN